MKERGDAEKILSGKKNADASRMLAISRALEGAREQDRVWAAPLRARLLTHWLESGDLALYAALSEAGDAVLLRSAPGGAAAHLPLAALTPAHIDILAKRFGIAVAEEPAARGLDMESPPSLSPDLASLPLDELRHAAVERCAAGDATCEALLAWAVIKSVGAFEDAASLCRFWLRRGEYERASRLLRSARYEGTEDGAFRTLCGEVELRAGRPEVALELLGATASPGEESSIIGLRIEALIALGRLDDARHQLGMAERRGLSAESAGRLASLLADGAQAVVSSVQERYQRAVEAGDVAGANEAIQVLQAVVPDDRRLAPWRMEVNALVLRARWAEVSAPVETAIAAGEPMPEVRAEELVAMVRDARAAGVYEAIAAESVRLGAALADFADRAHRTGEWELAAFAWILAFRLGIPSLSSPELAAWAAERAWVSPAPAKHLAGALVRVGKGRAHLEQGRPAEALVFLDDASHAVGSWEVLDDLRAQARRAVAAERDQESEALLDAARQALAAGRLPEALASVDRVRAFSPAISEAADGLRAELMGRLRGEERLGEQLEKARQELHKGNPFAARRRILQLGAEFRTRPEVAAALANAEVAAHAIVGVRAIPLSGPPPAPGVGLALASTTLGLGAVQPKDVRVGLIEATGCLMIATRDRLAIVDGETLAVRHFVELPEALYPGNGGDALFGTAGGNDHRIYLWGAQTKRLTALALGENGVSVESVVELARAFGRGPAKDQVAQSVAFHASTQALWVLDTFQRQPGKFESRLRIFSADDGALLVTEKFPFGIFQLTSLAGTESMVVSRMFEPPARRDRAWFAGGTLDARGRFVERWPIASSEDEIYGFRRALRSPFTGRTVAEYWFVDMLTGKVAGDGTSFVILKSDGALFYQNRSPAALLGEALQRTGPVSLLVDATGRDWLVWPVVDAERQASVAVVDAADVRLAGLVPMGGPHVVGAIRCDLGRQRAFAVVFNLEGGGFRVLPLDVAQLRPA